MTGLTAVQRLGEDGDATDGDGSFHFGHGGVAEKEFAAAHGHGREEDAVGELTQVFMSTADADIAFDFFVVGHHFFIGEKPIVALTIMGGGFEIDGRHAIALTAPTHAATAEDALTYPPERFVVGGSV